MAKPILFVQTDPLFFGKTTKKARQKMRETIMEQTNNEYHVVFHSFILDVKVANGDIPTKYF